MQTYCLHVKNALIIYVQKIVLMENKEIKGKSRCADCMTIKSFADKLKDKSELEIFSSQFLID